VDKMIKLGIIMPDNSYWGIFSSFLYLVEETIIRRKRKIEKKRISDIFNELNLGLYMIDKEKNKIENKKRLIKSKLYINENNILINDEIEKYLNENNEGNNLIILNCQKNDSYIYSG